MRDIFAYHLLARGRPDHKPSGLKARIIMQDRIAFTLASASLRGVLDKVNGNSAAESACNTP